MTYVVTEPCIACRYGDCAQVCPQDAFRQGPNFMVIDPRACANCSLCAVVCPVGAIHPARELPDHQREFVELNARLALTWPVAVTPCPLEDADANAFETDKRARLIS